MVSLLLIEDDQPIREGLERALIARGHAVVSAADGLEGLRRAVDDQPDIVVLDLEAPFMVDKAKMHSLSRNTPFDEARMQGIVRHTIVAGRPVYPFAPPAAPL